MIDLEKLRECFQQVCRKASRAKYLHEIEFYRFYSQANVGVVIGSEYECKPSIVAEVKEWIIKNFRSKDKHPDDYDFVNGIMLEEISTRMKNLEVKLKATFEQVLKKQFSGYFQHGKQSIKDIYQDSMLDLIQKKIRKEPIGEIRVADNWLIGLTATLSSFVIGIGRNKIMENQRQESSMLKKAAIYEEIKEADFNVERTILHKFLETQLHYNALPNIIQREVLRLYCFEGLSHKEIEYELGLSPNVSKEYLKRARKRILAALIEFLKSIDIEELKISNEALLKFWERGKDEEE